MTGLVLKACWPEQTSTVSQPSFPTWVSHSPPFLRFSNLATESVWCFRDGHSAINICYVPWEFTAGFLSFYPGQEPLSKDSWPGWREGTAPGAHFHFLMGKEEMAETLLAGTAGCAVCLLRFSRVAWSWKALGAPRSPFSLAHAWVPRGMDGKKLSLFLSLKFPSRVKIMPYNE